MMAYGAGGMLMGFLFGKNRLPGKSWIMAAVGFMTVISMLLTYSIANGIGIGAITYTVITIFTGKYSGKDVMVTIIALLFVLKFCMITM